MIGLDANILIRHITQDDDSQSARATEIIEQELTEADPGFVSVVALIETLWVLDRRYSMTRQETVAVVERLLQTENLVLEHEPDVFTALIWVKSGRGEFADALVAAVGMRAGCRHTLTFDRKALRLDGFVAA